MKSARDSAWLSLDPSRLPQRESLKYIIGSPLISAELCFELSGASAITELRASASVKIPFKKKIDFIARTEIAKTGEGAGLQFLYEERFVSEPIRHGWTVDDRAISYSGKNGRNHFSPQSPTAARPMVLNPLLLSRAFADTWREEIRFYDAIIVSGGKLLALRIHCEDIASGSTENRFFNAQTVTIENPDIQDFDHLKWTSLRSLEFVWNTQRNVIQLFRRRFGPFGSLEARLE